MTFFISNLLGHFSTPSPFVVARLTGEDQSCISKSARRVISRLPECFLSLSSAALLEKRTRNFLHAMKNEKSSDVKRQKMFADYKAVFQKICHTSNPKTNSSMSRLMQQHLTNACDAAQCSKPVKAAILRYCSSNPITRNQVVALAGVALTLLAGYAAYNKFSSPAEAFNDQGSPFAVSHSIQINSSAENISLENLSDNSCALEGASTLPFVAVIGAVLGIPALGLWSRRTQSDSISLSLQERDGSVEQLRERLGVPGTTRIVRNGEGDSPRTPDTAAGSIDSNRSSAGTPDVEAAGGGKCGGSVDADLHAERRKKTSPMQTPVSLQTMYSNMLKERSRYAPNLNIPNPRR